MRGSPDPCLGQDIRQTIQPVKDFSGECVLWSFVARRHTGEVYAAYSGVYGLVPEYANKAVSWRTVSSGI